MAFDPAEFLRNRRPELFSDSEKVVRPALTQNLLEYHLETLTKRKQETEFEYFCRRLAEKELCPNLRPQTGPSGGGDGKVDTETIPTSSEIARLWIGIDPDAAQQRWAFAFSAKKDWKVKAAKDIASIASTNRGYSRAFFITNQFSPSKDSLALEEKLSEKHKLKVTILDRSWIVKCIFEHDRIALAVEALGLVELATNALEQPGPRDFERKKELAELDKELSDPERYKNASYQLVEDLLRSAILARNLELPRFEVDGRFARADTLAKQVGSRQQRLRVVYEQALTAFWWYKDYAQVSNLYEAANTLVVGSSQADDFELLFCLVQVISAAVKNGVITEIDAKLASRRQTLKRAVKKLSTDKGRPNNALRAEAVTLLLSLSEAMQSNDAAKLKSLFKAMKSVVLRSERLGDFPFERYAQIIQILGTAFTDSPEFDELLEAVADTLATRRSQGEAGTTLLQRAYQKLSANKNYDAIRYFGRAQDKFIKHEYREELVSSLLGSAFAYENVGLLWAARNSALAATERCLAYFREDGTIVKSILPCIKKLIWLELQLGRFPQLLELISLRAALLPQLRLSEDEQEKIDEDQQMQDQIMGLLLLKADLSQLKKLESLPLSLEAVGLVHSAASLLFALGAIAELKEEKFFPDNKTESEIEELFKDWQSHPANNLLPAAVTVSVNKSVELHSMVLGVQITVTAGRSTTYACLAEAFLGCTEAFFATSLNQRIIPYKERMLVSVTPRTDDSHEFEVKMIEIDGEECVQISHPRIEPKRTEASRTAQRDALKEAIVRLMVHTAYVENPKKYLDIVAGQELGFQRALTFSEIDILSENVFGEDANDSVDILLKEFPRKRIPLQRATKWASEIPAKPVEKKNREFKAAKGEMPDDIRMGFENASHRQRRVVSMIDVGLWNKARWNGTGFFYNSSSPKLILGLAFRDMDAARKIFQGWIKRIGETDAENRLRISIIRGVNRKHLFSYNVVVSTNFDHLASNPNDTFITISRTNQMSPQSSTNLAAFLEAYKDVGEYSLAPGLLIDGASAQIDLGERMIKKTELIVKEAWQIGAHDLDVMGVRDDDDPLIPPDVTDPPVLELLKWRRDIRRRRST